MPSPNPQIESDALKRAPQPRCWECKKKATTPHRLESSGDIQEVYVSGDLGYCWSVLAVIQAFNHFQSTGAVDNRRSAGKSAGGLDE